MALTLNGSTGLSGIVGSAATPALQGTDTNTGYFFGTDTLGLSTGGTERLRIEADGHIQIGLIGLTGGNDQGLTITEPGGSANVIELATSNSSGRINFSRNLSSTLHTTSYIEWTEPGAQGTGELRFATSAASNNPTERLRITSDGAALFNGLTSQTADTSKLAVQGGDSNIGIIQVHAGGGESDGDLSGITFSHGADNATSRAKGAIALRCDGSGYGRGDLCFYVDGTGDNNPVAVADERIRIKSTGNVGIGTVSPSTKLSLEGSSGTTSHGILIGAKNAGGIRGVVEVHTAASTVGFNLSRTGGGSDTDVVRLEMDADSHGLIQVRNSSNAQRVRLDNHGIKFGTDTASANALDDYEEGNWTPSYDTSGAGGTISNVTYATQIGKYVKIGKTVYIEGVLKTSAITVDASGTYDIAGLPYPCMNSTAIGGVRCYLQSTWTNAPQSFDVVANTSRMRARQGMDVGDAGYTTGNTNDFNAGSGSKNRIYFSGQYRAQ